MTTVCCAGREPISLFQELAMSAFACRAVRGLTRQVWAWLTIGTALNVGLVPTRQVLGRDRLATVCYARVEHSCHKAVQLMCQTAPGVSQVPTRQGLGRSMDAHLADLVRIRLGRG